MARRGAHQGDHPTGCPACITAAEKLRMPWHQSYHDILAHPKYGEDIARKHAAAMKRRPATEGAMDLGDLARALLDGAYAPGEAVNACLPEQAACTACGGPMPPSASPLLQNPVCPRCIGRYYTGYRKDRRRSAYRRGWREQVGEAKAVSPSRCPLRRDWQQWDSVKRGDRLFMRCPHCGVYGSHVGQLGGGIDPTKDRYYNT